jgi:hypothetical protein
LFAIWAICDKINSFINCLIYLFICLFLFYFLTSELHILQAFWQLQSMPNSNSI